MVGVRKRRLVPGGDKERGRRGGGVRRRRKGAKAEATLCSIPSPSSPRVPARACSKASQLYPGLRYSTLNLKTP